jgi:serine/threonine-protein kinase
MAIQTFTADFLKQYEITEFFQNEKKGGQKTVHFPIVNGNKQVLKLFPGGKDERFDREMEIYEKFKHLNGLPRIITVSEYNGEVVLFEEFIEGHTLVDIIPAYAGNEEMVHALILKICTIMQPIWEDRYVHRDFKPHNIIIKENGDPVIIDFGIARNLGAASITATGWQPKSWMFASPEQYAGDKDKISYRTDFFSLGALAYYLYYQKLPFGNTEAEITQKFQSKKESFDVHDSFKLKNFCIETMKFSPAERPRLITDLLNLLQ